MTYTKQSAIASIDQNAIKYITVSDAIWQYAELSLQESRSMALYAMALTEAGFAVETNVCGIETAVTGTFGKGAPVIGILAEYDALSGLSQTALATEPLPVPGMENGHGCGHNLLGAGALAAACAIKTYLDETGKPGTVIFFGCPGEEGGAAKAFMAKQALWTKLDAALTWHPADVNMVTSGSCMACIQKEFFFTGTAAHAAGDPERGRSALDAAELMNIGVQFLREHMPKSASVHYSFTGVGGISPNVVQADARVLYMIRDHSVSTALTLAERVDAIAEGAAMMTGTLVGCRFIDGCSDTVPNFALENLVQQNYEAIGVPSYTAEETAFAAALKATYSAGTLPDSDGADPDYDEKVRILSENGQKPLNNFLFPPLHTAKHMPGSTDVGDVSWQTPTVQLYALSVPSCCPGHSWQEVSCGTSSIAHKALLTAGKVLAATAIDLIDDPALLAPIRAEFEKRTAAGYVCPIPDGAKPELV